MLVENFKPGTLARYALDYESLAERVPRLVYCSISGFGQRGPLAGEGAYDLSIQALSGILSLTGHPGQPPAKVPVAALDFGSALYGVIGVLSALRVRDQTGRGQWVQTSLLETALAWLSMHITSYLAGGEEPARQGTRSPFFAPYEAYATADGHLVVVGTGGDGGWQSFCRAIDLPGLADDPRFATNSARVAHAEQLRERGRRRDAHAGRQRTGSSGCGRERRPVCARAVAARGARVRAGGSARGDRPDHASGGGRRCRSCACR